jgi:hypothetical protein
MNLYDLVYLRKNMSKSDYNHDEFNKMIDRFERRKYGTKEQIKERRKLKEKNKKSSDELKNILMIILFIIMIICIVLTQF